MRRPPIDAAVISVALAALGFGIVLICSSMIDARFIQPILAGVLAASGTIGLLTSIGGRRKTPSIGRKRP